MDFVVYSRGKKSANPGFAYAPPPALTPAATKKLVERRNNRFVEAVNECVRVRSYAGRYAKTTCPGYWKPPEETKSQLRFCKLLLRSISPFILNRRVPL